MRTLLTITIPADAGNRAVTDGSLPRTLEEFIAKFKPEAAYFSPSDGQRRALFVIDLPDASMLPVVSEPFFRMGARVDVTPCMNLDELRAGLKRAMSA